MSIFNEFELGRVPAYKFRDGPVPFTGKKGRFGHFRSPQTVQEKRFNSALFASKDELPVTIEKIKRRKSLPSDYDDIPRSLLRSWKNHRQAQYKARWSVES